MTNINDIINTENILKFFGYICMLIFLIAIAYLNGFHLINRRPFYVYAIITLIIFFVLPYILNRGPETRKIGFMNTKKWNCPGDDPDDLQKKLSNYYCLGEIDYNLDQAQESDKIFISLQRSSALIVITLIFFGIFTNAIATNLVNMTAFSGGGTGQAFKQLTIEAKPSWTRLAYMSIMIVIINVISNLYIYFNCEDKMGEKRYIIRSFIVSQYNIIILSLIGIFIWFWTWRANPT